MPDRFATAAAAFLSAGLFADNRPFFPDNPDFASWVGQVGFVPSEVSLFAPPGSIEVVDTDRVEFVYRLFPADERAREPKRFEPVEPKSGVDFRVVKLKLKDPARDERKSHVFTLRQFRIVGRTSDGGLSQLSPIAIQQDDAAEAVNRHIRFVRDLGKDRPLIDEVLQPRQNRDPKETDQIEIVFAVPKGFEPNFIEYKRGARAEFKFKESDGTVKEAARPSEGTGPGTAAGEPAGAGAPSAGAPAEAAPSGDRAARGSEEGGRRGPRSRRVEARSSGSFFGDRMPMTLTKYRRSPDAAVEQGKLESGKLVAVVSEQTSGGDPPITAFVVPSNKRLLQLASSMLQTGSGLGGAMSFAIGTLQNYSVTDTNGNVYRVAGKYAIAEHGGTEYLEVQYYPDAMGNMGAMGKFDEIKDSDIKDDDTFVLLFLVDPGATIKSFTTGSKVFQGDELGGELVAPR
jgi:hypothetical protein